MSSNGCLHDHRIQRIQQKQSLIAGIVEHDARANLKKNCPVRTCMPHAMLVMQIRQPANDLVEVDVAKDSDCRKVISALADLTGLIPKPRFKACSRLGKVIAVVSQTTNAIKGLKEDQNCNERRVSHLCWECSIVNSVLRQTATVLLLFQK